MISKIRFADLPTIVRVMTCLSIFMGWVMLAEFVIDRHELDQFLPYYRVGNFCVYDLIVALALIAFWFHAHSSRGRK